MAAPTLIHIPYSPWSLRARWALDDAGVEYRTKSYQIMLGALGLRLRLGKFRGKVTVPVLIVNGENDFTLPYETAQKPFFDQLGTPDEHKRYVAVSGGHVTTDPNALIRETLAWLDRYLGPVER